MRACLGTCISTAYRVVPHLRSLVYALDPNLIPAPTNGGFLYLPATTSSGSLRYTHPLSTHTQPLICLFISTIYTLARIHAEKASSYYMYEFCYCRGTQYICSQGRILRVLFPAACVNKLAHRSVREISHCEAPSILVFTLFGR
jgi:hypothetical protein